MGFNYVNSKSTVAVSGLRFIIVLAMIIPLIKTASTAMAQATSNISVDLSILNDGKGLSLGSNSGRLAIPPISPPLSTLHVAPKKLLKLRPSAPLNRLTKKKLALKRDPTKRRKKETASSALNSVGTQAQRPQPQKLEKRIQSAPVAPTPSNAAVTKVTSAPVPPPPPTVTAPVGPGPKVLKAPPAPPEVVKSPPAPASKASKESAELANVPPTFALKPGRVMRIAFQRTETRIPKSERPKILTLANAVRGKEGLRLQVMAYAGGENLSTSKTRRMSLSRALAVRSLLIVNGVRSTQIDIRALGSKTDEKPLNRVDLKLAKR